jgi:hypothetical protein
MLVFGVLRFDYRAVPSYCATGVVLGVVETAAPQGTAADWWRAVVAAAVAMLVAWAVTRYLDRARAAARTAG